MANLHGRDCTSYVLMLARQLLDTVNHSGNKKSVLRLLLGSTKDRFGRTSKVPNLDGIQGRVAVFHSSNNAVRLAGCTLILDVDTIRLELEGRGIETSGLSYSGRVATDELLQSTSINHILAYIRKASTHIRSDAVVFDDHQYLQFCEHLANSTRLPKIAISHFIRRQLQLLAASSTYFLERFENSPPRTVMTHGGVNFVTQGVIMAAEKMSLPHFEIQHGALNMIDGWRNDSPLPTPTYGGLISWLRHSRSDHEIVSGPPAHRLREIVENKHFSYQFKKFECFGDEFIALDNRVAEYRARSSKPVLLMAEQANLNPEKALAHKNIDFSEYDIWVRGHPYRQKKQANALPTLAQGPAAIVLNHVDALTTVHSSLAVDACAFSVPVFFLSPLALALYPDIGTLLDADDVIPASPKFGRDSNIISKDINWVEKLTGTI